MSANCATPFSCFLNAKPAANAALVEAMEGPNGGGPTLDAGLPAWLQKLQQAGGTQGQLVQEWHIGVGHMRSTIVWTATAHGDFVFERLEADVKFDDASPSNFVTAEKVALVIDNEGVLTISGDGIQSVVLDFLGDPTIDFDIRMEGAPTPRFDGGISVYGVAFGTIQIQYVHGVFGSGENDNGAFMYFGISGQGSDTSSGTTVGMSLLVGTIDDISKDILKQHGFKELVDNLGEAGAGGTLTGVYARAYAMIPIFGGSCMLSINAGAEIGLWYFDVGGSPSVEGFVFGSKLRGFATGDLICVVTIRGDITIWFQIVKAPGGVEVTAGGEGWVAGGLGFCDSETWTDWEARWWDDNWCWMCGQHLELIYNGNDFEAEGSVDCG